MFHKLVAIEPVSLIPSAEQELHQYAEAVSYTHLDVYKRQGVWFAMSFELTMRGVLFLVRLARGRWLDKGALA